jgi:hypothetical protein
MAHCEVSGEGGEGGLRMVAFSCLKAGGFIRRKVLAARCVNGGNAVVLGFQYDSEYGL